MTKTNDRIHSHGGVGSLRLIYCRRDGARVRGPTVVRLNNTGLLAKFTVESAVNEDSSPNAITGTIPDFPCKPGETPLETCLRLIRHLP
jgi:hypothetical protein